MCNGTLTSNSYLSFSPLGLILSKRSSFFRDLIPSTSDHPPRWRQQQCNKAVPIDCRTRRRFITRFQNRNRSSYLSSLNSAVVRHGESYARWWRTALADKEEQLLRNVLYKTVLYRAFLVHKWLTSSSLSTIEVSVPMMLRVTLYKCDFERRCGYRGKTCEISDPKLADTVYSPMVSCRHEAEFGWRVQT